MKILRISSILALLSIIVFTACGGVQSSPTAVPDSATEAIPIEEAPPLPTETFTPSGPVPLDASRWSTTASTRTELSFAFPGEWDGSSPLTFGEGEFVKDPEKALGVTFQIGLAGDPAALLANWGSADIGIIGIVTFPPEVITDGENVVIARVEAPTRVAQGNSITAQVAYIPRPDDVLEVMWFAPTEEWQDLQPTFQALLESVEMWRVYADMTLGLHTMYVHDWLDPQPTWEDTGLWFRSADEQIGTAIIIDNEIADPVQKLGVWSVDRLQPIGFTDCTLAEGDRMDAMSGQWESKMGECTNANGTNVQYEVTYIPDKDRLLEIINYAPSETWEAANRVAFKYLLSMLIDLRP